MSEIWGALYEGIRQIFIWPVPLAMLGGIVIGLVVGILPGIGGIGTLALFLPFVYKMEPPFAIAFMLGMHAVCNTSGGLTAVLFAIPGESSSSATLLDGFPMAQKGQAAKACSIVLTASMVGGVIGALALALCIPVMRTVIKAFGPPEFLMMVTMGIAFVGALSGKKPLIGIACGGLGLLLSLIGDDPITGSIRYTFGWIYLWDGLQLVPLTVGLFAIGELLEYGIERTSINQQQPVSGLKLQWDQVWEGAAYVFKHFGLTVRCSLIGMLVGAVPGIGGVVAAFIAYGHAKQTSRHPEEFGLGSPEGVLAPEASDNAKEGGALIPTIGFGIPGSAAMALILAAFMILGLKPGPEMLTKNLSLTFTIVWTLVIANVVGAVLVLSWVPLMARVTNLRAGILVPLVLILSLLGASSRGYPEDVLMALFFGLIGYVMRLMDLPRAPVILGFVLGRTFEINLHLTMQIFGPGFLLKRPIALVLAAIIVFTVSNELISRYRRERRLQRASAS